VYEDISFNDLEKMTDDQIKQLKRDRMITKASPTSIGLRERRYFLDVVSQSIDVEKPVEIRKSQ